MEFVPTTSFGESQILKVTPGRPSRYMHETRSSVIAPMKDDRQSSLFYYGQPDTIPARLKLYLHQIKLSGHCIAYIRERLEEDSFSITLQWEIFRFEDFVTLPEKLHHRKAKFDFTAKYQLDLDETFIEDIKTKPIIFKVFAEGHDEILLGESEFFIPDLAQIVNVKQIKRVYFTNNDIAYDEAIAYLDIWYKFTCKQQTLRALLPASRTPSKKRPTGIELLSDRFTKKSQDFADVHVTDSEFDHFADSVLLVLNRNKVLKTTQEDIDNELQERVRWLRFEANWKQTLQENAILHGKNPDKVVWRQWREEDTTNVRLRTYDDVKPKTYNPELSITVLYLYFLAGCPLLKNDEIQQFYVEYSFLGYEGPKMESPFSAPKGEPEQNVTFNFRKTFGIDLKKDRTNCEKLTELIKNDGAIKFMIISEPKEDEQHPIQTCQEIGFADVPLSELIQLEDNKDVYEYEIIDIHNSIAVLGYLAVQVEGILAMRKMALDLMAPEGYKLYM